MSEKAPACATSLAQYSLTSVVTANDGAEALAVCADRREEVQIVLTDVIMPHLDGAGMIRALQRLNPALKVLATSRQAESQERIDVCSATSVPFILKPFTTETLLTKLHELLAGALEEAA